jgi:hypothetical protein
VDGSHHPLCPYSSRISDMPTADFFAQRHKEFKEDNQWFDDQRGVRKGFDEIREISGEGNRESNPPVSVKGGRTLRDKIYDRVVGGLMVIIVGFIILLVIVMWYPFKPAFFYKPITHTPIVKRGDLVHYTITLDKFSDISPAIQRTLECGKDDVIIVLENAVGTTVPGSKRTRSIKVEIPKSVPPNRICKVLTHVEYPYFGGLRKVKYDIYTDPFEIVE